MFIIFDILFVNFKHIFLKLKKLFCLLWLNDFHFVNFCFSVFQNKFVTEFFG